MMPLHHRYNKYLKEKNIFVFNLMGSPGAGKTSLLEATLQDLVKDYKLAVIEGDLFTSKDAERISCSRCACYTN